MKLTLNQIQFIEEYLIKNKVKYWDVRMELLDHIVNAVEEKITNGKTFENALEEVHLNFGNKSSSKQLSKNNQEWIISKSIYADNSGYKKLIVEKHKELSKGINKKFGKYLLQFFSSPFWLVVYIVLIIGLMNFGHGISGENFSFKVVMIPLLVLAMVPIAIGLVNWKRTFKSIYLSSLISLPMVSISLFNMFIYFPKAFVFGEDKSLPHWYFVILFSVLFPLIIAEIKLFIDEFKKYKTIQNKLA